MTNVSVILCCYNSAGRLPDTLRHIGQLICGERQRIQVVIVDNASKDNTAEVARYELGKIRNKRFDFRIIHEPTPGLSFAREAGIAAADHDYLIFCDDDNWLECNYVLEMTKVFDENPEIALLGGNNAPVFDGNAPDWFQYFYHSFAVGVQSELPLEILTDDKYIVGAGMCFRKDAFNDIKKKGYRFYLTDRKGSALTGGGDVELSYIFRLAGYKIAASSKLTLQHLIPARRLNVKYLKGLWKSYPRSWLVFEAYKALLQTNFEEAKMSKYFWRRQAAWAL